MRLTFHNGRKHKNGKLYSQSHNDRSKLDDYVDEHIDKEKTPDNIYYNHIDGIYTNATAVRTFKEAENIFYDTTFKEYAKRQKKAPISHPYSAPEEVLFQIGTIEESVDSDVLQKIATKYIDTIETESTIGGRQHVKVLDWALHRDEPNAADHFHFRLVYVGEKEYNAPRDRSREAYRKRQAELKEAKAAGVKAPKIQHQKIVVDAPCQTSALASMGYSTASRETFNNAKKDYTAHNRQTFIKIANSFGIDIDTTKNPNRTGLSLSKLKYHTGVEEEKVAKLKAQRIELEDDFNEFQRNCRLKRKEEEAALKKLKEQREEEARKLKEEKGFILKSTQTFIEGLAKSPILPAIKEKKTFLGKYTYSPEEHAYINSYLDKAKEIIIGRESYAKTVIYREKSVSKQEKYLEDKATTLDKVIDEKVSTKLKEELPKIRNNEIKLKEDNDNLRASNKRHRGEYQELKLCREFIEKQRGGVEFLRKLDQASLAKRQRSYSQEGLDR